MKTPNAIVVLAGGIKQDTSGRWESTDLTAKDSTQGAPGGKLRVFAGAELAGQYPEAIVIASGGKGYDVLKDAPKDRPFLAEILRDELVGSGVPESRIVLETNSHTTYQQLQQLELLVQQQALHNVVVVSNRWHLPRIETLLAMKFPALRARIELASAEEILLEADPMRWGAAIARAYSSAFMAERIAREERGIAQIKNGTYDFTPKNDNNTGIVLRPVTMDDAKNLFDWRNDIETRTFSANHNVITWDEHISWLSRSLGNHDCIMRIAEASGNPVGTVRADKKQDGSFEISYTISPPFRGKGIGKKMVLQFVSGTLAGHRIMAKIKKGHAPSENIARALGLNPTNHEKHTSKNRSKYSPIVEWR